MFTLEEVYFDRYLEKLDNYIVDNNLGNDHIAWLRNCYVNIIKEGTPYTFGNIYSDISEWIRKHEKNI